MRRKVISTDQETRALVEEWFECGPGRGRLSGVHSAKARAGGDSAGGINARPRHVPPRIYPRGQFVYFIQAGGPDGLVKVGCTRNLTNRMSALRSGSPLPTELLGYIPGWKYTESVLHGVLDEEWEHHEWFRPSERLLALARGDLVLNPNNKLVPAKRDR